MDAERAPRPEGAPDRTAGLGAAGGPAARGSEGAAARANAETAPSPAPDLRTRWSHGPASWILLVVVALIYFGAAKLGLSMAFLARQVSPVWPPTGIALVAVLLLGPRVWPGIFVGALLINATVDEPLGTATGIAVGNTLEALLGAWLLQRGRPFRSSLEGMRDVLGLVGLAAGLSTTVSATVGVTSLCLGGVEPWSHFGTLWGVWWLGDAMGALVTAPLLLTWLTPRLEWRPRRGAELFAVVAAAVGVCLLIFARRPMPQLAPGPALEYAAFPFLVWASLRGGPRGAALVTFATSAVAIIATLSGSGPFAERSTHEGLVLLQAYMGVVAVTGLFLAAAIAERDRAERSRGDAARESEARLRGEEALLRRSEERYRSLVLASAQVVWSTNPRGEVVEDLPTWREFTGQTTEEAMGRGWMERLHPDDRARVAAVTPASLAGGKALVEELRIQARDGSWRQVRARAVPVRALDGRIREWVGTCTDITERKALERELRERAEQLADADRRKDEFLAMLGHELRNPLGAVSNALEVLRTAGLVPGGAVRMLDVIERQVRHLTRLVDDLLEVSRITRGEISLRKESVDVRGVVVRAVETAQPWIDQRGHRLTLERPPEPMTLDGDPMRLEQVFANLLHNAAKYTEPGGRIEVRVAREDDHAAVRVRDNGIGIAPELLPHVFELFTQGDRSLDRTRGGLGIGLTLVKRIVELHGGTIEARSEGVGRGSELIVRLPAAARAGVGTPAPMRPVADVERHPDRLQVLIVEDQLDAAESLAELVRLKGYEADVALDGPAALERAAERRPDVVLLDLGLPGLDGYAVAGRLRELPGLGSALLVALSGYGRDEDRRRSQAAGIDHHLVKPVDFRELDRLLASVRPGAASG
jgi:two-component system CheB/CheR fusion protein